MSKYGISSCNIMFSYRNFGTNFIFERRVRLAFCVSKSEENQYLCITKDMLVQVKSCGNKTQSYLCN